MDKYNVEFLCCISSSHQLTGGHCWIDSSKVCQTGRSCGNNILRVPATLTRSSLHLVGGLAILHR